MKRLLPSFVVAAFSLWACPAFGEVIDKPADIIAAVRAGKQGAWLDVEAMRRCALADSAKTNLELRINVLLQERDVLKERSNTCDAMVLTGAEQIQSLKEQSEAQNKLINSLGRDLAVWYRNPLIVGVIGLAVGAVATAFVVVAAK